MAEKLWRSTILPPAKTPGSAGVRRLWQRGVLAPAGDSGGADGGARREEGEFSLRTFAGRAALLRDVLDELGTVAMFGGNRLVVIKKATISSPGIARSWRLRRCAAPAASSCWSWSRCRATHGSTRPWPPRGWASIAAPPPPRLTKWLVDWAKQQHRTASPRRRRNADGDGWLGTGIARYSRPARAARRRRESNHLGNGRAIGGRLARENRLGHARCRVGRQCPRGHPALDRLLAAKEHRWGS